MSEKAYKKMVEVPAIEMPLSVMRFFVDGNRQITFYGDQASLGEDYGSIGELRNCVDWLADQFGGKVKWEEINE